MSRYFKVKYDGNKEVGRFSGKNQNKQLVKLFNILLKTIE